MFSPFKPKHNPLSVPPQSELSALQHRAIHTMQAAMTKLPSHYQMLAKGFIPQLTSQLTDDMIYLAVDQIRAFADYIETGDMSNLAPEVQEVITSGI